MAQPITVVIVPVEGDVTSKTIADPDSSLEFFNKTVGGYIEHLTRIPSLPGNGAIINEEGKVQNLPRNPRASALMAGGLFAGDFISGTFVVVGDVDGEGRLSSADAGKVQDLLGEPIVTAD